ncbi:MAG: hypothetical protein MR488_04500 [Lachnospiraceae bacterium]|nr:hypothetical protein [Lachnospiraceae bacterium]HCE78553.1 hypothetical protein [Lachnospiraceae bacterium]
MVDERLETRNDRSYYTGQDVAEALGISVRSAQDIIRRTRLKAVENHKLPADYPRGKIPKALMKSYFIA